MKRKMPIYFVTGSDGKFEEVKAVIPSISKLKMNKEIPEIQSLDAREVVRAKIEEVQKTYRGLEIIIEDTSLCFDCLKGKLPGPYIKDFLKTFGNDGIYDLVNRYGNYGATARTIIGYGNGSMVEFFEGSVNGKIVSPTGETSFGWDPIFMPDGYDRTFQQMTREEKNEISMRRIAVEKLKRFLEKQN